MSKLFELLFISGLKGVGKKTIHRKYLSAVRRCEDINDLRCNYLPGIKAFTEKETDDALEKAKAEFDRIDSAANVDVVTILDEHYPDRLRSLEEKAPLILYMKGDTSSISLPSAAIVGTRKPSGYSVLVEQNLVSKIIELSGRVIISGLATGCDTIAHETALKAGGKTLAVLPSGVENVMPAQNRRLAAEIIENGGCLVSEYPIQAEAYRGTFIERDGLIAALSDLIVVIECGVKSGTMHTVNAAALLNKPIACFSPDDLSRGSYEGNLFMVRELNAISLNNTIDLERALNLINAK